MPEVIHFELPADDPEQAVAFYEKECVGPELYERLKKDDAQHKGPS